VLDSLDEMDLAPTQYGRDVSELSFDGPISARSRALAVLRALNVDARPPVILACRIADFIDITSTGTFQTRLLTEARHVALRPLDNVAIRAYLTQRFHDPDGTLQPRWRPLVDALEAGHRVAQAITTPWELYLTVTAYKTRDTDPGELLDMPTDRVRAHLISGFLPAITDHDEDAARQGWTAADITRWLTTIALHQHRQAIHRRGSETDIVLPDLWRVAERAYPRWLPAALASVPFLAAGALCILIISPFPVNLIGIILILVGLGSAGSAADDSSPPLRRFAPDRLRTASGRRDVREVWFPPNRGGFLYAASRSGAAVFS
jgi:hypothetical protein